MRDTLIIGAAIIVAIALGAWLLMSGAERPAPQLGAAAFNVLSEGQDAGSMTERKNYRIKDAEQLQALWQMVKGEDAPFVDFERYEVLAIFDGTRSSGGYSVAVTAVEDTATERAITITRTAPGDTCITTQAITSPYTIVVAPKTDAPIVRTDVEEIVECE